jgi:alkanesulfonate monooxygenase
MSGTPSGVSIRAAETRACEISWFAPLCSDDFRYLGVPETELKSSFAHTRDIALTAERYGFNNILCPSSFQVGPDPLVFAAALSQHLDRMSLLLAVRSAEIHPPMLARALATLDHIMKGRLTVNIISSELPGESLDPSARYRRSRECLSILKACFTQPDLVHRGEWYPEILLKSTDPCRPYQQNGGPLFYFGGLSPEAKDLCAAYCDVFLMWPETEDRLMEHMRDMSARAAAYGRVLDFGLRVHLIVRESEEEARQAARMLVSRLDDAKGAEIRSRAQDALSFGVSAQASMRERADADGYCEPLLWTGVGRARSGCGCALVGTPAQVLEKINRYIDMGIRAFIFSGYPHREECQRVGDLLLPHLERMSLPFFYGRVPAEEPLTPLGRGVRI